MATKRTDRKKAAKVNRQERRRSKRIARLNGAIDLHNEREKRVRKRVVSYVEDTEGICEMLNFVEILAERLKRNSEYMRIVLEGDSRQDAQEQFQRGKMTMFSQEILSLVLAFAKASYAHLDAVDNLARDVNFALPDMFGTFVLSGMNPHGFAAVQFRELHNGDARDISEWSDALVSVYEKSEESRHKEGGNRKKKQ